MIFTAASILALAVSALAQTAGFDAISKPTEDEQLTAGDSYAITWEPSSTYTGTVSIALLGGATPQTLQVLSTISSGVKNSVGSYSWTVGSDLGNLDTYGIRITLDSDTSVFQYSYPFHITASEAEETTVAATTSSSSTATVALSTTSSISTPVTSIASTAIETSTTCTTSASVSSAPSTSAKVVAHVYNSTASAATTLATAVSPTGSLYTTKSSNYTKSAITGTASANQTTATSTVVQAGATSNAASFFAVLVGGLAVSFFLM